MSVKFFGEFLIERGEIRAEQLREALQRGQRENVSIGELAVETGYLSLDDVYQVNHKQSHIDMPFGELAVSLELMTAAQLENLTRAQDARNRNLSQLLLEMGISTERRLAAQWAAFQDDQAPFEDGEIHLPEELADDRVAAVLLDLLPKLCRRVARLRLRIARAVQADHVPEHAQSASIRLRGRCNYDLSIAADHEFSAQLAAGACGFELAQIDDALLLDGIGEFLNVLAGSAMGRLEQEGIRLDLDPPSSGDIKPEGQLFDLTSSAGRGVLLLRRTAQ